MRDHFRIGFGREAVTPLDHQLTQRLMVFNDAVMYDDNMFRDMRVRIRFGRLAVSGPTGMSDTGAADQRMLLRSFSQLLHLAYATQASNVPLSIHHRQAGGVIAAILQTAQTFQQYLRDITLRYRANNSTHSFIPDSWRSCAICVVI